MYDSTTADRDFLALWEHKRVGRLMPARRDFSVVTDLRPFLGSLMLTERVDGDWRFRIFGTTIAALLEVERQGQRLSDLAEVDAEQIGTLFARVLSSQAPLQSILPAPPGRRIERFHILMLPLSDDGETVSMILSLVLPASADERAVTATAFGPVRALSVHRPC